MTLSPEHIAHAHRRAEESAAAQGLPAKVEDTGALAKIAAIFRNASHQKAEAS